MKIRNNLIALVALTALSAAPGVMAGGGHAHQGAATHGHGHAHGQQQRVQTTEGTGEVRSIGRDGKTIVLHHDPMPALNWPAMVMRFQLADPGLAEGVEPGDRIAFTLEPTQSEGQYTIIELQPAQ